MKHLYVIPALLITSTCSVFSEEQAPPSVEVIDHNYIAKAIWKSMEQFSSICISVKDSDSATIAAENLEKLSKETKLTVNKLSQMKTPSNEDRIRLTKEMNKDPHPLDKIFSDEFDQQKAKLDDEAKKILEEAMNKYIAEFDELTPLLEAHMNPDETN
ncbi:hypothetical protein ACFPK9_00685 [Rubritalea spongiae]|uniref:DUF4142 domain-containing protein n=1 Tax=Rubritalea spongiae TaxID=430797 RepID=A0ABW5E8V5_9BACT